MPLKLTFTEVKSTNIKAVAHAPGHGLFVDFQNGRRYIYKGVPDEIHEALIAESKRNGGSVGRAFKALVKDPGYEYVEVETHTA